MILKNLIVNDNRNGFQIQFHWILLVLKMIEMFNDVRFVVTFKAIKFNKIQEGQIVNFQ